MLKERQAGAAAADLCREHGIGEAMFHAWRSKHGRMEASDAERRRGLEEENAELKKLLAASMLDVSALREMLAETGDARLAAASRGLGDGTQGLLAAAGAQSRGHRAEDLPLRVPASGRRCRPGPAACLGR